MRSRQLGLTLIEVMVVVAIISVLATIVYPLYTDQLRKSRRASATVALASIAQAQERFFTANSTYATTLDGSGSGNLAGNALDVSDYLTSGLATDDGFYTIAISGASATAYTLTATANGTQTSDYCSSFSLTQSGIKSYNSSSNSVTCW